MQEGQLGGKSAWHCTACTYLNKRMRSRCAMCQSPSLVAPQPPSTVTAPLQAPEEPEVEQEEQLQPRQAPLQQAQQQQQQQGSEIEVIDLVSDEEDEQGGKHADVAAGPSRPAANNTGNNKGAGLRWLDSGDDDSDFRIQLSDSRSQPSSRRHWQQLGSSGALAASSAQAAQAVQEAAQAAHGTASLQQRNQHQQQRPQQQGQGQASCRKPPNGKTPIGLGKSLGARLCDGVRGLGLGMSKQLKSVVAQRNGSGSSAQTALPCAAQAMPGSKQDPSCLHRPIAEEPAASVTSGSPVPLATWDAAGSRGTQQQLQQQQQRRLPPTKQPWEGSSQQAPAANGGLQSKAREGPAAKKVRLSIAAPHGSIGGAGLLPAEQQTAGWSRQFGSQQQPTRGQLAQQRAAQMAQQLQRARIGGTGGPVVPKGLLQLPPQPSKLLGKRPHDQLQHPSPPITHERQQQQQQGNAGQQQQSLGLVERHQALPALAAPTANGLHQAAASPSPLAASASPLANANRQQPSPTAAAAADAGSPPTPLRLPKQTSLWLPLRRTPKPSPQQASTSPVSDVVASAQAATPIVTASTGALLSATPAVLSQPGLPAAAATPAALQAAQSAGMEIPSTVVVRQSPAAAVTPAAEAARFAEVEVPKTVVVRPLPAGLPPLPCRERSQLSPVQAVQAAAAKPAQQVTAQHAAAHGQLRVHAAGKAVHVGVAAALASEHQQHQGADLLRPVKSIGADAWHQGLAALYGQGRSHQFPAPQQQPQQQQLEASASAPMPAWVLRAKQSAVDVTPALLAAASKCEAVEGAALGLQQPSQAAQQAQQCWLAFRVAAQLPQASTGRTATDMLHLAAAAAATAHTSVPGAALTPALANRLGNVAAEQQGAGPSSQHEQQAQRHMDLGQATARLLAASRPKGHALTLDDRVHRYFGQPAMEFRAEFRSRLAAELGEPSGGGSLSVGSQRAMRLGKRGGGGAAAAGPSAPVPQPCRLGRVGVGGGGGNGGSGAPRPASVDDGEGGGDPTPTMYKGVQILPTFNGGVKYTANICMSGKQTWLGTYKHLDLAFKAVDLANTYRWLTSGKVGEPTFHLPKNAYLQDSQLLWELGTFESVESVKAYIKRICGANAGRRGGG